MEFNNINYESKINHVGELLLNALKECPDPYNINQIDATTGEEETFASFLKRSVAMAYSLRVFGAKAGDVIAIAGRNNIHVHVPFYAAMYNGIAVAGVDPTYQYDETKALFETTKPKLVFCNQNSLQYMEPASKDLNLKIKFIALDGDYNLDSFMKDYLSNGTVQDFKVSDIDTKAVYCWLMSTSGTSGHPKQAAFTHHDTAQMLQIFINSKILKENIYLNLAPLQWASGYYNAAISTLTYKTRVQMSAPPTIDAIADVINKYKPNILTCSAPLITLLLNYEGECDLSCFHTIKIGGSKLPQERIIALKKRIKGNVIEIYGQTEILGPVFTPDHDTPIGSVGKPYYRVDVKLFDIDTEEVITEPNKIGHLLVKGPRFAEYYKNPKATEESFTNDGWYKTGDLFYRDENNCYYFVERINMLIKYMGIHILPPLLEDAIRAHEGVHEVVVIGIPNDQLFEVPVACVVRNPGSKVTAREIKDIIASKFAEGKHLRGGVVFMDEMILTSTGKVARHKLREFALNAKGE